MAIKLNQLKDPRLRERIINTIRSEDYSGAGLPHTQQCQCSTPLAGDRGRETQGSGCPIVRFTLYRVRLLDVDAKYASVKDCLDSLAIAGIIRGDREGQVRLEVEQEKVKHFKEELTIIEIIWPENCQP